MIRKNSNAILYEGHVRSRLVRRGDESTLREVMSKNSGGLPLVRFLADCLYGSYASSNRPMYAAALTSIDGQSIPSDVSGLRPLSPFPVPLSNISVSSDAASIAATVSMSFIISGLSISGNEKVVGYALYSSSNVNGYGVQDDASNGLGDYSAITIVSDRPLSVGSGENLVVTWDLVISNA